MATVLPDEFEASNLLLTWLGDPERFQDPRRIELICQFVERFPRSQFCRSPMVAVDAKNSPEGFQKVEAVWDRLLRDSPGDVELIVHFAMFVANADRQRAMQMLRPLVEAEPGRHDVWFSMGRIAIDVRERLELFTRARTHGCDHPNLDVWIAHLQARVGDFEAARASARVLLTIVDEVRTQHGDSLDWRDRGGALWDRARAASKSTAAASTLVNAIGTHAYLKHWGHTVAGLVALHDGLVEEAVDHLRQSGEVVGEHRLGSYGPSMSLAAALCSEARWGDVAAYLADCSRFWPDERVARWKEMVDRHVAPDFPEP